MKPAGPSTAERITLLGVEIDRTSRSRVRHRINELLRDDQPSLVFFVNAHSLNLSVDDHAYRQSLRDAALVLNDGIGVTLAASLFGQRFRDNLNGTDLTPEILRSASRMDASVYLLGGAPGVASRAGDKLKAQIPGLRIVGSHHGYFSDAESGAIAQEIRSRGAKLLLVGMGNPLQEKWLTANLAATGATVGVGVGAFLDFTADVVTRAPPWMRSMGLEWAYRLSREPGRLWRRYLIGNVLFILRVARTRLATAPGRDCAPPGSGRSIGIHATPGAWPERPRVPDSVPPRSTGRRSVRRAR